jgi:hypothetical protein
MDRLNALFRSEESSMTTQQAPSKPNTDCKSSSPTELQDLRKRLLKMIVSKEAAQKDKPR